MALAAAEGTERDQTSAFKKFTYNISSRMKLSRNTGITDILMFLVSSVVQLISEEKLIKKEQPYLFSFAAASLKGK